jgi:hypothetical protein
LAQKLTGMSARRKLPAWRRDVYRAPPEKRAGTEVLLFVDCFARYFEPENARAARSVLEAGGYTVVEDRSSRPLCCGRTFLSSGLVDQAREELTRLVKALGPRAESGVPIVGLEPSCLLTLRDELSAVVKEGPVQAIAKQAMLFEELIVAEARRGTLSLPFRKNGARKAVLHGHCHQKALGTMPDVVARCSWFPAWWKRSSRAVAAGIVWYEAEHYDVSMRMAERSLPAVRAGPGCADRRDGTSAGTRRGRDGAEGRACRAGSQPRSGRSAERPPRKVKRGR